MSGAEGWFVTTGSYSNYSVLCLCPDEATALAIADAIPDACAESAPIREQLPTVELVLRLRWSLALDGTENPYPYTNGIDGWESTEFWWEEPESACDTRLYKDNSGVLVFAVNGWDHDRVRKVFTECKARITAQADLLRASVDRGEIASF